MTTSKPSHDDDHLDFTRLEKEVQTAVINEERYWRENDVKIRAVQDKVATYDEFRDRVLAAHIKPLEKDDSINKMGRFTQVWNQPAQSKSSDAAQKSSSGDGSSQMGMNLPQSGQDFVQQWRRYCKTLKAQREYLITIGPQRISELFKMEISGGLLGEFMKCLQTFEDGEDITVLELLEAFQRSQRFSLSLAFFSKEEKSACVQLFDALKNKENFSTAELGSRLTAVEQVYCK